VTYQGTQGFIDSLTTPYGTSLFSTGLFVTAQNQPPEGRWLEMTDPRGGRERVEYRSGVVAVGS